MVIEILENFFLSNIFFWYCILDKSKVFLYLSNFLLYKFLCFDDDNNNLSKIVHPSEVMSGGVLVSSVPPCENPIDFLPMSFKDEIMFLYGGKPEAVKKNSLNLYFLKKLEYVIIFEYE